jgi:hypothetical protein
MALIASGPKSMRIDPRQLERRTLLPSVEKFTDTGKLLQVFVIIVMN